MTFMQLQNEHISITVCTTFNILRFYQLYLIEAEKNKMNTLKF